MTVAEFIEVLQRLPPDLPVLVADRDGEKCKAMLELEEESMFNHSERRFVSLGQCVFISAGDFAR